MKLYRISLIVSAVTSLTVPAFADTYMETKTIEEVPAPMTQTEEVRTIETAPVIREVPTTTVIREQPVVVSPVTNEKVIVKKHGSHLIKVGPVKVF